MKKIKLTQGKFALVDDEDFEWLMKWKWHFVHGYAMRKKYLGKQNEKYIYKDIYMHRLILATPKGLDTDHINNFKLDNRRKNLRIATRRQNLQNRFFSKRKNSNLPMGVGKHHSGKWRARITVNGKELSLGSYNTSKEAGIAYNWATLKYFKNFANPNNISNWKKEHPVERKKYIDAGKNNTSGIVGVSLHKKTNKWQVRITFNRKRIYLGIYENKLDAIEVYNKTIKKYYGKLGRLNQI